MTRTHSERRTMVIAAAIAVFLLTSAASRGHGQVAQPRAPGSSARDLAPIDLTGYWVSVVTEDWRYRMVMPAKGDYGSVPLNANGRREADKWTPDQAGRCEALSRAGPQRSPHEAGAAGGVARQHLSPPLDCADRPMIGLASDQTKSVTHAGVGWSNASKI